MAGKSDIFIYDIYGIDPIPIKKILQILKPILINYKIRDKKFMWVNLRGAMSRTLIKELVYSTDDVFFERTRLDKPHTILVPDSICNP